MIPDPNAQLSPTELAASRGHLSLVETLVKNGAILNKPKKDFSALTKAVEFGHLEVVQFLLKQEIQLKGDELHLAASSGHLEIVECLIDTRGTPVDSDSAKHGGRPLHMACRHGHVKVVKELINNHADIEAKSSNNHQTPLHVASANGQDEVV